MKSWCKRVHTSWTRLCTTWHVDRQERNHIEWPPQSPYLTPVSSLFHSKAERCQAICHSIQRKGRSQVCPDADGLRLEDNLQANCQLCRLIHWLNKNYGVCTDILILIVRRRVRRPYPCICIYSSILLSQIMEWFMGNWRRTRLCEEWKGGIDRPDKSLFFFGLLDKKRKCQPFSGKKKKKAWRKMVE